MRPEDRDALRADLERALDRIDEIEDLRAESNKGFRTELTERRGHVKQVRKWLSGKEPYQPELPLAGAWNCAENGHVFKSGACNYCGGPEPVDPASCGAV